MPPVLGLVIAYVVGSIPFAYLAGRLKGIDLREHGSGNLGATNALRVLGWKIGVPVFALDLLKGALPVLLLPRWIVTAEPHYWAIGFGLAAIVGHVRPIFLLWKGGGKGVATAAGVFLALAPTATLFVLVVWGVVFMASGYVSLASLFGAAALPIAVALTSGMRSPVFAVSLLTVLFVYWTHRANIGRLRRGEEHRFGRPRGTPAP